MNILPLRGRVRILCDEPPKRIGSIIVPDQARDNPLDRKKVRTGIVIAMGPPPLDKRGREKPYGFEVGERVMYQFGQLSTDGTDAWCAAHEILGVVERGDPVPAVDREAN